MIGEVMVNFCRFGGLRVRRLDGCNIYPTTPSARLAQSLAYVYLAIFVMARMWILLSLIIATAQ